MEPFEKFSEWQDMDDFLKKYWTDALRSKDSHRSIRINGHLYWLYDKATDGTAFLPFGGASFYIQRKNSNRVEEVMMWDNADVPNFLKEFLPDNATNQRKQIEYVKSYFHFARIEQAVRHENLAASKIGEWSPQLRGYMEAAKISSGDMLFETLAEWVKGNDSQWDWA